ncbi:MAG: hypothetical protein AAF804_10640 [Bacteroidota bacterium]
MPTTGNSKAASVLYPTRLALAAAFALLMGIYLLFRSDQSRDTFTRLTGPITYLAKVNPTQSGSDPKDKVLFLTVEGSSRVFELFVGEEWGDFSPRVNRLAELKVGDQVEIYFQENEQTQSLPTNKLLQYLDHQGEAHYQRGGADRAMGYTLFGLAGLLLIWAGLLWRKREDA